MRVVNPFFSFFEKNITLVLAFLRILCFNINDEVIIMDIGERIKTRRKEIGLSAEQVAD